MRLVTSWLKIETTPAGVRRVPINVRSLTGTVNGQEFESSLERDLLLLVHWDYEVLWYQSQPVKIEYVDALGKARTYTPDLLVTYKAIPQNRGEPAVTRKPLLCEVKYRVDLIKQRELLKPKFRAARDYASANNYEFRAMTEREIRTEYLKNVQFLWSYRFAEFHQRHYEKIDMVMHEMEETDPATLLEACYASKTLRGEGLWTLWCMIARSWIKCDLNKPLNMQTRIWMEL